MSSSRASAPAKHLFNGFIRYNQPHILTRTMATEINLPNSTLAETFKAAPLNTTTPDPARSILQNPSPTNQPSTPPQFIPQPNPFLSTTTCTLHSFPSFEPTATTTYPSTHLLVPLRKDILHRAVIYEGDATRQGTANTLYRTEVRGSNRKIRPQKGTGSARLGDKKSPMLRGGCVAFGPKPRDFSTELPQKIYDLAWRIALSHRYRLGQLIILANEASLSHVDINSRTRYLHELLHANSMANQHGRTLFVTRKERGSLFSALAEGTMGKHARAVSVADVDVKDLLEMGRVVVERGCLEEMFVGHQSDLARGERWYG